MCVLGPEQREMGQLKPRGVKVLLISRGSLDGGSKALQWNEMREKKAMEILVTLD